jgi:hypothetical protein
MATIIDQETFFRCASYQDAQEQTLGYESNDLISSLVENIKKILHGRVVIIFI